jgi:hypothetical protein
MWKLTAAARQALILVPLVTMRPCAASSSQPWGSSESTLPSSSFVYPLLAEFQRVGALDEYPRGWFRTYHAMSRSEAAFALKSVLDTLDSPTIQRGNTGAGRAIDSTYLRFSPAESVELLRPELERLGITVDRELLIEALDRSDLVSVRTLQKRTKSTHTRGRLGMTVLMLACAYGDIPLVESELAAGADTEVLDTAGATAMFYAAGFGTAFAVERLAKAGADVGRHDTSSGRTPLMYAAHGGRVHTVRALLRLGADPLATAGWRNRASSHVPSSWLEESPNHRAVLRMLLEAEAALTAK